jgi:hypothetical protein
MAGTSWTTSDWSNEYMTVSHFLNSDIKTLNAGNKVEQWSGSVASQWAIMSYLGRVAYNYNSKYYFTQFRAMVLPSWLLVKKGDISLRFSEAIFGKFLRCYLAECLKLRGGLGRTGKQSGIGGYSYLQLMLSTGKLVGNRRKAMRFLLFPRQFEECLSYMETATQSNVRDLR